MQGTRRADGEFIHHELQAGEYGRVLRDGAWVWVACTPNGMIGDLSAHEVQEHEDGTITVAPSVEIQGGAHARPARGEIMVVDDATVERSGGREGYWHGYLERGVWRS
jgi:hypothetical protein